MRKPWVRTSRYGGRPVSPARPAASSGTSRGADRCLRDTCLPASQLRRAGEHRFMTRSESNQTSRMSRSRSNAVPPHDGHANLGNKFLDRAFVPGVRAVLLEDRRGPIDECRREDRFAARHAVDRRNRHTPGALARDAPVRPIGDHVEDPVASPRRNPFHFVVNGVCAASRSVRSRPSAPVMAASPSMRTNHCEVARKMTGL